jgi:hypothetical protein
MDWMDVISNLPTVRFGRVALRLNDRRRQRSQSAPQGVVRIMGRLGWGVEGVVVIVALVLLGAAASVRLGQLETASQVALAHSRMAEIGPGLEAYVVDHGALPPYYYQFTGFDTYVVTVPAQLTSPIAYVRSAEVLRDPFSSEPSGTTQLPVDLLRQFVFFNYESPVWGTGLNLGGIMFSFPVGAEDWRIESMGPDMAFGPYMAQRNGAPTIVTHYDPTNGTISAGNIVYKQTDIRRVQSWHLH